MALRTSPSLTLVVSCLFRLQSNSFINGNKDYGQYEGIKTDAVCVTVSHLFLFYSVIHTHVQTHIMYTHKQARGGVRALV